MKRSTPWAAYATIADTLRRRITEDAATDSALPSETLLAGEFHVARNTIRRALAVLEDEGLIQRIPGRGRVVRRPDPDLEDPDSEQVENSYAPAYRRIAADLRQSITSGDLTAGARVPSESALMGRYAVSRGTARHALTLLEVAGLIRAEHGKGRFVHGTGTIPSVNSSHGPGRASG